MIQMNTTEKLAPPAVKSTKPIPNKQYMECMETFSELLLKFGQHLDLQCSSGGQLQTTYCVI